MSTVDEILAALNADADDDAGTKGSEGAGGGDESSTIKELRAKIKADKEANKLLAQEVVELRTFRDTTVETGRKTIAVEVFKGLELPEEHAALFLKNHEGEVTPEAIKQFVIDYKLPAKGVEGLSTEEKSEGFTPGGASSAESQGPSKVTRAQLDDLLYSDPARANKLIDEGKVDWTAK